MFRNNEQKTLPYRMLVFHEVIKSGSFTGAAERLGHTRSAISTYISQLESLVGTTLMTRSTRRLSLTPAGRQFALRCEQMAETLQLAIEELQDFEQEPQGRITITAPHAFESLLVESVIAELCRQYPKLIADVTFSDQRLDLLEHKLDMAISVGPQKDSDYHAIKLGELRSYLVAAPKYLESQGSPEPLTLSHHTLIQLPWQEKAALYSGDQRIILQTSRIMKVNTLPAAINYAIHGLGVLLAPSIFVADAVQAGKLERAMPGWQAETREVFALHTFGKRMPFILRQTAERLKRQLEAMGY
ncbi:LysR family transcriptional regulator [Hahella ganghwensis]|uniref:LysR family transcriptional regulator n=1 Tax=Hahella ganghwensis TaxID=286420 RepID=UPI00039E23C2|nr:LysR family transcriptional regulator [Hahella ganghwensis]